MPLPARLLNVALQVNAMNTVDHDVDTILNNHINLYKQQLLELLSQHTTRTSSVLQPAANNHRIINGIPIGFANGHDEHTQSTVVDTQLNRASNDDHIAQQALSSDPAVNANDAKLYPSTADTHPPNGNGLLAIAAPTPALDSTPPRKLSLPHSMLSPVYQIQRESVVNTSNIKHVSPETLLFMEQSKRQHMTYIDRITQQNQPHKRKLSIDTNNHINIHSISPSIPIGTIKYEISPINSLLDSVVSSPYSTGTDTGSNSDTDSSIQHKSRRHKHVQKKKRNHYKITSVIPHRTRLLQSLMSEFNSCMNIIQTHPSNISSSGSLLNSPPPQSHGTTQHISPAQQLINDDPCQNDVEPNQSPIFNLTNTNNFSTDSVIQSFSTTPLHNHQSHHAEHHVTMTTGSIVEHGVNMIAHTVSVDNDAVPIDPDISVIQSVNESHIMNTAPSPHSISQPPDTVDTITKQAVVNVPQHDVLSTHVIQPSTSTNTDQLHQSTDTPTQPPLLHQHMAGPDVYDSVHYNVLQHGMSMSSDHNVPSMGRQSSTNKSMEHHQITPSTNEQPVINQLSSTLAVAPVISRQPSIELQQYLQQLKSGNPSLRSYTPIDMNNDSAESIDQSIINNQISSAQGGSTVSFHYSTTVAQIPSRVVTGQPSLLKHSRVSSMNTNDVDNSHVQHNSTSELHSVQHSTTVSQIPTRTVTREPSMTQYSRLNGSMNEININNSYVDGLQSTSVSQIPSRVLTRQPTFDYDNNVQHSVHDHIIDSCAHMASGVDIESTMSRIDRLNKLLA